MFSTIVVPFDFTPACQGALRHAAAIAEHEDASLYCIYVYEDFLPHYEFGARVTDVVDRESVEEAQRKLERKLIDFEPENARRTRWRAEVLEGNPAFSLAKRVAELEDPLVVVPTHGRGRFRRFLMGSTVNKLLHDLECPVLTGVHLEDSDARFPEPQWSNVLCAIGLHEGSESVLQAAAKVASRWEARLTVVNAVSLFGGEPVRTTEFPMDLRRYYRDGAAQDIAALLQRNRIEADVRVEMSSPEKYVPVVAEEIGADLLIVGRGHVKGFAAPFRHHVYDLIRGSAIPVLSFKEVPSAESES